MEFMSLSAQQTPGVLCWAVGLRNGLSHFDCGNHLKLTGDLKKKSKNIDALRRGRPKCVAHQWVTKPTVALRCYQVVGVDQPPWKAICYVAMERQTETLVHRVVSLPGDRRISAREVLETLHLVEGLLRKVPFLKTAKEFSLLLPTGRRSSFCSGNEFDAIDEVAGLLEDSHRNEGKIPIKGRASNISKMDGRKWMPERFAARRPFLFTTNLTREEFEYFLARIARGVNESSRGLGRGNWQVIGEAKARSTARSRKAPPEPKKLLPDFHILPVFQVPKIAIAPKSA